jgi:nucleotide sugar dehydrogenase
MVAKSHKLTNDMDLICLNSNARFQEIIQKQNGCKSKNIPAGIAIVIDNKQRVIGTITDGDLRRALLTNENFDFSAKDIMAKDPILFPKEYSYQQILEAIPSELEKRDRKSRGFLGKIIKIDYDGRPTGIFNYHHLWEQRVAVHRNVAIIGMGYVGLTLALGLSEEGFHVTGVDVNQDLIRNLSDGKSHIHETGIEEILNRQLAKNLKMSTEIPDVGDIYIMCVGTPLNPIQNDKKSPDLSRLLMAAESIGGCLKNGDLVVLRSTVPPGTTREKILPVLESTSGLLGATDFHLSFAPERTIEGGALEELRSLPQIIGGLNRDSVEATVAIFRELTSNIIRVESIEAAEFIKLINNCYRDLSFAFSNQVAQIAQSFDINIVECIQAANSGYPRDQVPFPSPGVGGPCLTKDPYFLAFDFKSKSGSKTLSEYGRSINEGMIQYVVDSVLEQFEKTGKNPLDSQVLVCGLAFKGDPETTDLRGSSALEIANELKSKVNKVLVHDPVISCEELESLGFDFAELPTGFKGKDAVLFLNNHSYYKNINVFNMAKDLRFPGIIYDGWHLFRHSEILDSHPCVYVGLSFVRSSVNSRSENKE